MILQAIRRRAVCWLLPLSGWLLVGCYPCSTQQSLKPADKLAHLPRGPVGQVTATWDSKVVFLPDFVNQGTPTPGLAGRLYLFGPDGGNTVLGDGTVTVEAFDEKSAPPGGQPEMVGQWNLTSKALHSGLSKDIIGWGYNMFLPLTPRQQATTSVNLRLAYKPPQGPPMYAANTPLHLAGDRGPLAAYQPNRPPQQPYLPLPQPFVPPPPTPLPSAQPGPTAGLPHQQGQVLQPVVFPSAGAPGAGVQQAVFHQPMTMQPSQVQHAVQMQPTGGQVPMPPLTVPGQPGQLPPNVQYVPVVMPQGQTMNPGQPMMLVPVPQGTNGAVFAAPR